MTILKVLRSKYRYQIITLVSHISLLIHYYFMPWWYIAATLIIGWIVSSLGHNLFAHRYMVHRHFVFSSYIQVIGHFLFSLLNIGSIVTYCSVHLKHHKFSGKKFDPHSHQRIGVLRTIFNIWDKYYMPEKHTYHRYLSDPICKWFHLRHELFAWYSAVLTPYMIVVSFWLQKILVIVIHIPTLGYVSPSTPQHDTSVNIWWLKPLMLGEELHNNHHLYASHANHNVRNTWKEFDPMYYVGKFIERSFK